MLIDQSAGLNLSIQPRRCKAWLAAGEFVHLLEKYKVPMCPTKCWSKAVNIEAGQSHHLPKVASLAHVDQSRASATQKQNTTNKALLSDVSVAGHTTQLPKKTMQ